MKEKFHDLARRTAIIAVIAGGALFGIATPQAYAHYCGDHDGYCNGCLSGFVCAEGGAGCEDCCASSCTLDNCSNDICVLHCAEECATACAGQPCAA